MIVLGLGYGDEGKGLTTSYLCSRSKNPIVVRFNGGHQAGHTVVYEGKRHIFSGFGSGSLQGVPTFWSNFCTFYPPSFLREYKMLPNPVIFVDPMCPVTTPFDILKNRRTEDFRKGERHGSVGMGFGETLARQESYYKLFVQDLRFENVVVAKLKAIAKHHFIKDFEIDEHITYFLKAVKEVLGIIRICNPSILLSYDSVVMEGAQGILLDMDHGFFPNVTRSNTTCKNALTIHDAESVYYVTRTYLTRHGNGYMPNEEKLPLINNENETNKSHAYQGEFRTAKLDIELMNYALECDSNYSAVLNKNLVITCNDQYPIDIDELLSKLNVKFDRVFLSDGDSLNNITQYK